MLPSRTDLVINELRSTRTLEGYSSHSVHIVSCLHCFFSSRALLLAPPDPVSRSATSYCLPPAPLCPSASPPPRRRAQPRGTPIRASWATPASSSPAPHRRSPITFRVRLIGPPNRGWAGPPATRPSAFRGGSAGGRAGPQHSRRGCRTASGLRGGIGSAGGGTAARGVLGRGGGRHRPAGRAPQLRPDPRCGTQD